MSPNCDVARICDLALEVGTSGAPGGRIRRRPGHRGGGGRVLPAPPPARGAHSGGQGRA